MKLWMMTLLAIVIGLIIAIFIPLGDTEANLLFKFSELSINIGRYIVFPLVFFSLAIVICKLRRAKRLLRTTLSTIILILASTILLVIVGVLITLIYSPTRIPLIVETQSQFNLDDLVSPIFSIFPQNLFSVFTGNSNLLLPLYFLSFLLGFSFYKDREVSEPAFNLFDSFSRIFYDINKKIVFILPLLVTGISYSFFSSIIKISDKSMFSDLFIILGLSSIIVIFLIYPLVLFLVDKKTNPYKSLISLIIPLLTGLISRDSFFSLSILTNRTKEKLQIPRKVAGFTLPLCAMFAKAGTAMVCSITFITILKSYSSLEITLFQIFWVILFSILISLTLASVPSMGAYTALYLLSNLYSQNRPGLTDSYLLIKPIVPILIGFAVLLDVTSSAVITILVNKYTERIKE